MRFLTWKALIICFLNVLISCNQNKEALNNEKLKLNTIDSYITNSENKSKSLEDKKEHLLKLLELVNKLPNNSLKINSYQEISYVYYSLKEYDNYKKLNYESLELSINISDSIGIASSHKNLGIYYANRTRRLDSAYKNFFAADKIYSNFDNENKIDPVLYAFDQGKILIELAKLARKVNNYSESEALTIGAIEKFKLSGNLKYLPLSYSNLGTIAKYTGRYKEAINYHLKTIEFAKNTEKDRLYKVISYNNIGTVYKSQRKYDKAIEYYNKALSYKEFLKKQPKRYAIYIDNLGYAMFLADKTNDSTLYLFNKAYRIRDSVNDIVGLSTNYLHYTEYYQSKENDSLSRVFAEKAKLASTKTNSNTELLRSYQLLAQVSPPEEGRRYAMEYIKLSDSLTKRDNLFRDKFARIRFESENLEKENEQKNKEIQEVQDQNTIYLLGLLLLITFIGFLIYFSRQRTRYLAQQNKIVEFQAAYEAETRISKRLHDELGNDIFQVMMQYQHDPHDPQITKKLNTAYTKARDISRENSEFEVDETYQEELTDMLTNYTKNNIRLVLRGIDKINWDTVDKNLKITIYRVLQELMTNMQKHSQADLVAVVFKNEKNKIIIKYSDNGVGIEKSAIKSKNGLRNTEKRMLAINGTIIFDSEKNKGFKAEIVIPS